MSDSDVTILAELIKLKARITIGTSIVIGVMSTDGRCYATAPNVSPNALITIDTFPESNNWPYDKAIQNLVDSEFLIPTGQVFDVGNNGF